MNYELIKSFIGPDGASGISLKELLQTEKKLGKFLPDSLRKYYQYFGKALLLTNASHELIDVSQLATLNGYLVFYIENQRVWIAGIPLDAFPANETAVWLTYDEGQSWEKFCDSLSEFLISMSLIQILEGWPYVAVKEGVEDAILERVIPNWQELSGICSQINTRFFTNSAKTQLLGLTQESADNTKDSTYFIRVATSDQEDYDQIIGKLGIEEWDYSSRDDQ